MRLWIIIVQDEDAGGLLHALLEAGIETYAVASSGGFLRRGNVTLLVALRAGDDVTARALAEEYAHTRTEVRTAGVSELVSREFGDLLPAPLQVTVAGAVVFGLRVARLETW